MIADGSDVSHKVSRIPWLYFSSCGVVSLPRTLVQLWSLISDLQRPLGVIRVGWGEGKWNESARWTIYHNPPPVFVVGITVILLFVITVTIIIAFKWHKKHGTRDLQQNFCVFLFRNTINRSKLSRTESLATRDSLAPNYFFFVTWIDYSSYLLSFQMAVIFNKEGLKDLMPPCVIQQFVNHDARLFKVGQF